MKKLPEANGWVATVGGKHVAKEDGILWGQVVALPTQRRYRVGRMTLVDA